MEQILSETTNGDAVPKAGDSERPTNEVDEVQDGAADPRSPEQRYASLVEAVKRHQAVTAKSGTPRRPRDHELYRRLKSQERFAPRHSAEARRAWKPR
jgi:hypothetical protein